eukprot:SAG11_NODE_1114_length_5808_cov_12.177965_6_plen_80_part_00
MILLSWLSSRALLLRVRESASHDGPIEMGQHTTGLHRHELDFQMVMVLQGARITLSHDFHAALAVVRTSNRKLERVPGK